MPNRALADTIILGGSTFALIPLLIWIAYRILQTPQPQPWKPKAVRDAIRRARLAAYARLHGAGLVPGVVRRTLRRRGDYDCVPLPMVLIGYFEEA